MKYHNIAPTRDKIQGTCNSSVVKVHDISDNIQCATLLQLSTSMDMTSMDRTSMDMTSMDMTSMDMTSMDMTSMDMTSMDMASMDMTSMDRTWPQITA